MSIFVISFIVFRLNSSQQIVGTSKFTLIYSLFTSQGKQGFHSCFSFSFLGAAFPLGGSPPTTPLRGFSMVGAGCGVGGTSFPGASLGTTSGIICRVTEIPFLFFSLHSPLGEVGVEGASGGPLSSGASSSIWQSESSSSLSSRLASPSGLGVGCGGGG